MVSMTMRLVSMATPGLLVTPSAVMRSACILTPMLICLTNRNGTMKDSTLAIFKVFYSLNYFIFFTNAVGRILRALKIYRLCLV